MVTKRKKPSDDPLALARARALAGDPDAAIAALSALAKGSASASASLAELLAFLGDWPEVLANAARLIAEPGAVYAGNVFDDMVRLAGLAGHRGVPWPEVEAAARAGLVALASETRPHVTRRLGTILEHLAAYAARRGEPPHELVRVFGVTPAPPTLAAYQAAVALASKKPKKTPVAQHAHLVALAVAFEQPDELVRLVRASADVGFEHATAAARVLVQRGDGEEAWSLVAGRLPVWFPVDHAQVAPVVLVTDPELSKLGSAERWRAVLTTPRGTQAGIS